MYPCPCCEFLTLGEPLPGTYEICPVCYWEDDNVQADDPNYAGGANHISLEQAKRNFAQFGAIAREFLKSVRKPLTEEIPINMPERLA
jgi:hypothetical protein